MFTKEFTTPYTPNTSEEDACNYILTESGLLDYLNCPIDKEHTNMFKVTITVEEVK
jgi:hypothetical protein